MKKFLLLALAAFALAACNDDDTPDEFVQGDNTIAVFENDRLVFYDYDVFWEYSEPYTDPYGVTCIDLYMNKTRFVQNMPALDMEVPGIPIHPTPAGSNSTCDRRSPIIAENRCRVTRSTTSKAN